MEIGASSPGHAAPAAASSIASLYMRPLMLGTNRAQWVVWGVVDDRDGEVKVG